MSVAVLIALRSVLARVLLLSILVRSHVKLCGYIVRQARPIQYAISD
jgi:hypothetical protein